MNDKKEIVVVTGSSGFIGSALARRLTEKYKVIGLDQGLPREKIPGVSYYPVNMASPENVFKIVNVLSEEFGRKISSVVHLVAYYSFDGKPSSKYEDITVNGTKFLLNALNRFADVDQFIFSSTMLVHAPSSEKINEGHPLRPGWAYPQSKVDAEKIISNNRENISVLNLRIPGVYEDNCHSIPISQHIARIYECQFSSVLFPGNSKHGQCFLHLEDLIDAILAAIEKRTFLPEISTVLLGEDNAMSYENLQERIGTLTHDIKWPVIRVPRLIAKTGARILAKLPFVREPFIKPWMIQYADDNYIMDVSKAFSSLGWKPRRNLESTLPKMIEELKNDPHLWYKKNKIDVPPLKSISTITDAEKRLFWAFAILNTFLGIWLISNPFTQGQVSSYEFWSDIISGIFIIIFSLISMLPPWRNARWLNVFAGSWLMLAPLLFWSESAAIYSNDTLIGGLVMLFAGFTPSSHDNKNEVPSGWSYNPSSWPQRLPIMTLAFIGFLLARYLAAFQLGHIPEVWDPFFPGGSEKILKSDISKAFPVSDGGLGAMSYLMDVIAAAIGDRNRYRTMPWMVILFGLFIVPTGVTSITLVMLQPIAVNAWCTICLITAFIMLIMVPPAIDEVVATVQFLRRSKNAGKPFWKTFWIGGEEVAASEVLRPEGHAGGTRINVIISTVLGVWLLFVPEILNITDYAANNLYIVGALVITSAVIAYADVARIVRIVNIPLGAWLCISPWFLNENTIENFLIALGGAALIFLSIPRGKVVEHFGSFDPWVHFNLPVLAEWLRQKRRLRH